MANGYLDLATTYGQYRGRLLDWLKGRFSIPEGSILLADVMADACDLLPESGAGGRIKAGRRIKDFLYWIGEDKSRLENRFLAYAWAAAAAACIAVSPTAAEYLLAGRYSRNQHVNYILAEKIRVYSRESGLPERDVFGAGLLFNVEHRPERVGGRELARIISERQIMDAGDLDAMMKLYEARLDGKNMRKSRTNKGGAASAQH
ncbi:MAG: hypothetical protein HY518_00610 [Candidatus Aenigmarchaeota archaeon]|nr:hypothetical protein [Candidatus Aenigmarchaeota archaeon]